MAANSRGVIGQLSLTSEVFVFCLQTCYAGNLSIMAAYSRVINGQLSLTNEVFVFCLQTCQAGNGSIMAVYSRGNSQGGIGKSFQGIRRHLSLII